jgi:hypothetical protein
MHRAFAIILGPLGILLFCAAAQNDPKTPPQSLTEPKARPDFPVTDAEQRPGFPKRRVVIATNGLLDGRGHVLPETRIVVEGSKIVAIDPKASPIDYDLRGLTVMPGWIDSHVHIT